MGTDSKIEWCHHTFNPWWGCVEDGPECDHCYARAWAKRTGHDVWGPAAPRRFFGDLHWRQLTLWDRAAAASGERHRVFCASMADIAERRSDAVGLQMDWARLKLWGLVEALQNLDFLLLTKRPQNLPAVLPRMWLREMPRNVWLGTTAGTRRRWQTHVKYLRRVGGSPSVLFVSAEPLLEDVGRLDLDGIHWVIVGSESGGGARPMETRWATSIVEQCRAQGAAPFVKQIANAQDRKGGDPRFWPPGNWPREFPRAA